MRKKMGSDLTLKCYEVEKTTMKRTLDSALEKGRENIQGWTTSSF